MLIGWFLCGLRESGCVLLPDNRLDASCNLMDVANAKGCSEFDVEEQGGETA